MQARIAGTSGTQRALIEMQAVNAGGRAGRRSGKISQYGGGNLLAASAERDVGTKGALFNGESFRLQMVIETSRQGYQGF